MQILECLEHLVICPGCFAFLLRRYNVKNLQKYLTFLKNKRKVTEGKDFRLDF